MDIDPRRPITEQLQEPPKPREPLTMRITTHIACRECGGVATMRTPSHPGARFCSVQCICDLEKRLAASEPDENLRSFLGLPDGPISFELAGKIQEWAEEAAELWSFEEEREQYLNYVKSCYYAWKMGSSAMEHQQAQAVEVLRAARHPDSLCLGFGQVHVVETPDLDPHPQHRVWTSWLEGNLVGELYIVRADLPRERQAMRQLLHERLQQFRDALLLEWEKQVFEEDT